MKGGVVVNMKGGVAVVVKLDVGTVVIGGVEVYGTVVVVVVVDDKRFVGLDMVAVVVCTVVDVSSLNVPVGSVFSGTELTAVGISEEAVLIVLLVLLVVEVVPASGRLLSDICGRGICNRYTALATSARVRQATAAREYHCCFLMGWSARATGTTIPLGSDSMLTVPPTF
ncbi:MAG: hypothetical protein ACI4J3_03620 [Oscillospiraceae bacterium]